MRRPSPLPPPQPREARPRPEESVLHEPSVGPEAPASGLLATDDSATAPLLPLAPHEADGVEERDAQASAELHRPMRARDVWRAARARRRALRAEVRRFTARQRHRRMAWWSAAAAVVLLVLGSVAAAYSPLFAVERVRVVGVFQLDAATVESALTSQLGRPLPAVDSSEVKAALVAFPLVESYTLEARPPHDLVVRIVERTPVGAVKSSAGYTLVDAAGVALATTDDRPADHPLITVSGGVGSAAFDAIGRVYRSLPDDIRTQVTAMKATTANDVTLRLGETATDVVWGSATASAQKALVLEKTMKARPPSEVSRYDVSSPTAVVVR